MLVILLHAPTGDLFYLFSLLLLLHFGLSIFQGSATKKSFI